MTMSRRQDNNEKQRVWYLIQPEPQGIVMAESMIPKDEDWTEYWANEFLFPFCAFWTSYLYVELFLLLYSSEQWVFQQ